MNSQPALEHYTVLEKIGEGSYGVVHKCRDNKTEEIVALKAIKFHHGTNGIPQ